MAVEILPDPEVFEPDIVEVEIVKTQRPVEPPQVRETSISQTSNKEEVEEEEQEEEHEREAPRRRREVTRKRSRPPLRRTRGGNKVAVLVIGLSVLITGLVVAAAFAFIPSDKPGSGGSTDQAKRDKTESSDNSTPPKSSGIAPPSGAPKTPDAPNPKEDLITQSISSITGVSPPTSPSGSEVVSLTPERLQGEGFTITMPGQPKVIVRKSDIEKSWAKGYFVTVPGQGEFSVLVIFWSPEFVKKRGGDLWVMQDFLSRISPKEPDYTVIGPHTFDRPKPSKEWWNRKDGQLDGYPASEVNYVENGLKWHGKVVVFRGTLVYAVAPGPAAKEFVDLLRLTK